MENSNVVRYSLVVKDFGRECHESPVMYNQFSCPFLINKVRLQEAQKLIFEHIFLTSPTQALINNPILLTEKLSKT